MLLNNQQLCGLCDSHVTWLSEHVGIHTDMQSSWSKLTQQAELAGFSIKIASGFRSFERQLSIWNRKFTGELTTKNKQNETVDLTPLTDEEKVDAILVFSALPGTSRHHWGSDIDIYADNLLKSGQQLQLEPWEYEKGGPFEALSIWLNQHAEEFGFFLPYDKDRGGVAVEPWHLSYAPIAKPSLMNLSLENLTQTIEQANILGKEAILKKLPTIFTQYVKNINKGKNNG